jgi:arylsulfatase A-like enzyme
MSSKRPNLLCVVLDSVRRDHVSCYGYQRVTTPRIDRLAAESTVYENAFSASCWTVPSHASLFTGKYPSEHRADFDTLFLSEEHTTLAESLSAQGYDTACVTCNGFVSRKTGLARGFGHIEDVETTRGGGPFGKVGRRVRKTFREWSRTDRGAKRATRAAGRWLRERDQDRPFFLFLNLMECHLPYGLKDERLLRFVPEEDRARARKLDQDPFAAMAGSLRYDERDISILSAMYDGCLHYMDDQVGGLLDTLADHGLDETVVVVTADHGESFGEHGLYDHQYGLYEHLTAVPLIVHVPAREAARSSDLVELTDLVPVLSRLPEVTPVGDGLLPVGREYAVSEYVVPNTRALERRFPEFEPGRLSIGQRTIRSRDFRLIEWEDGEHVLFDRRSDPGETRDVASANPETAVHLRAELNSILGPWPARSAGTADGDVDEAIRERLRQLGYL